MGDMIGLSPVAADFPDNFRPTIDCDVRRQIFTVLHVTWLVSLLTNANDVWDILIQQILDKPNKPRSNPRQVERQSEYRSVYFVI